MFLQTLHLQEIIDSIVVRGKVRPNPAQRNQFRTWFMTTLRLANTITQWDFCRLSVSYCLFGRLAYLLVSDFYGVCFGVSVFLVLFLFLNSGLVFVRLFA